MLDLEGGSKKHTTDFFKSTGHSLLLVYLINIPKCASRLILESPELRKLEVYLVYTERGEGRKKPFSILSYFNCKSTVFTLSRSYEVESRKERTSESLWARLWSPRLE